MSNNSNNSSFLKFKSMIGLKGRDLNKTNVTQNSFMSLNNITISSTFSMNSFKKNSFTKMRRYLTSTKLTRNKTSVLSPKNLNNEIEAKERADQIDGQRMRPSISSPTMVNNKKQLTQKIMTTPISTVPSNSRMFCRQSSKLWIESIPTEKANEFKASFSPYEYKRQEAIYELMAGEMDLCYDLGLIEATYQNSLIHLEIIDETEAFQIFGDLHALHSVHFSLVTELQSIRDNNGIFGSVGKILIDWTPRLDVYEKYCSNQRTAKQLLENKIKSDKRMNDFLQRCLQSPFSRRLDLWAFLDVPRNRLVKYPLLFRSIKKYSTENSFDNKAIECAIVSMEKIVSKVDYRMGEEECKLFVDKIEFDKTCESNVCLFEAKAIICSGTLRNNRGTKLLCILFDNCFALTRPNDANVFVLYRQPILIDELRFDSGNHIKIGGSLNRTLNGSATNSKQFVFRVYSTIRDITFTLQAKDSNNLRLWLNKLTQIVDKQQMRRMTNNPTVPKIMSRVLKENNQIKNSPKESPRKKFKSSTKPDISDECFV